MKKTIIAIMFIVAQPLFAQPIFEKTFGAIDDDMGFSVSICNDNSYIICGYIANLYTGDEDIYIAKISIYGDTIWTRKEGSAYNYDKGLSVKQTYDHGYIVTGLLTVSGESVPFLLKYDNYGNKQWLNDYSQYISSGRGFSVLQTADSGYVFCGDSYFSDDKNILWNQKACLLKTDVNGGYLWDEDFGGYGVHYATDICFSEDNGFVISGQYDTPGEYTDAWLFKTNENGNLHWNKTYGGSSSMESGWKVRKTNDGGYIFCGSKFYGLIYMYGDIYVVKTDGNGNEEWSKTYGTDEDERGSCIDVTDDGGYIICGSTDVEGSIDIWMIRADSQGDTLWTRKYGGASEDRASEIHQTNDGGFIVCGSTNSYGNGGDDIYLFKTNWNGTLTDIEESRGEVVQVVTIAPNPTDGVFHIENCTETCKFEISDLNGNSMLKGKINSPFSSEINIGEFPSGTYILKVKSGNGIKSFKLLKQ